MGIKALIKNTYKITTGPGMRWQGTCPSCGEVFTASDIMVPQIAVLKTIQDHETAVHGG